MGQEGEERGEEEVRRVRSFRMRRDRRFYVKEGGGRGQENEKKEDSMKGEEAMEGGDGKGGREKSEDYRRMKRKIRGTRGGRTG